MSSNQTVAPNLRVPKAQIKPLSQTELQNLYSTVNALSQRERALLFRWLLQLMKPNYAHSISRLPRRSYLLLLVSAGALYGALFSAGDGIDDE